MRILEVDKLSTLPMSSDRKADGRSRTHLLPHGGVRRHAERGISKTHGALGIAWAIHVGVPFLRWRHRHPRRGLLLDGEMRAVVLKERLARIAGVSEYPAQPANLKIAAADLTRDGWREFRYLGAGEVKKRVEGITWTRWGEASRGAPLPLVACQLDHRSMVIATLYGSCPRHYRSHRWVRLLGSRHATAPS